MNAKIVENFITETLNFIPSIYDENFNELILVFFRSWLNKQVTNYEEKMYD